MLLSSVGGSGCTDYDLGLTWRLCDEFLCENCLPSALVRVGGIIEGNYDTGFISAIGDADFTPSRFPEVEEDREIVCLSATFNVFRELLPGVDVGQVVDERNATKSDVASFNLGYSF